jgi:hypothetical protein
MIFFAVNAFSCAFTFTMIITQEIQANLLGHFGEALLFGIRLKVVTGIDADPRLDAHFDDGNLPWHIQKG